MANVVPAILRKLVQENSELKTKIDDYEFQKFTLTTTLSTIRVSLTEKESLAVSLETQLKSLRQTVANSNARNEVSSSRSLMTCGFSHSLASRLSETWS